MDAFYAAIYCGLGYFTHLLSFSFGVLVLPEEYMIWFFFDCSVRFWIQLKSQSIGPWLDILHIFQVYGSLGWIFCVTVFYVPCLLQPRFGACLAYWTSLFDEFLPQFFFRMGLPSRSLRVLAAAERCTN